VCHDPQVCIEKENTIALRWREALWNNKCYVGMPCDVTRRVCEKIALKIAQPIFFQIIWHRGRKCQNICATFVIDPKLPKVNSRPMGENIRPIWSP
jgi:hypothetical protein